MHPCFEPGTQMVDSNINIQCWWEVERDAGRCRLHVGLVGGEVKACVGLILLGG